jgi:hypothetical protein
MADFKARGDSGVIVGGIKVFEARVALFQM